MSLLHGVSSQAQEVILFPGSKNVELLPPHTYEAAQLGSSDNSKEASELEGKGKRDFGKSA